MSNIRLLKPQKHVITPKSFNRDSAPYTCPELGRNAGIPESRFDAYKLPSRMGDRLVYPKNMSV